MPTQKDTLKNRLARYRQIKISVIGRKSGQTISVPSGSCSMARTLPLPCEARTRSGTRTCSEIRDSARKRGVWAHVSSPSRGWCQGRQIRD